MGRQIADGWLVGKVSQNSVDDGKNHHTELCKKIFQDHIKLPFSDSD